MADLSPLDEKRTAPSDVVYFIQAGDQGPIKIGCTCHIRGRLATIRGAHRQRALTDFAERLLSAGHDTVAAAWHAEEDAVLKEQLWPFVVCVEGADVEAAAKRDPSTWGKLHATLFGIEPLLDMELRGTMPGYEAVEARLHEEFAADRLHVIETMRLHLPHHEWFRPSARLLDFIAERALHHAT